MEKKIKEAAEILKQAGWVVALIGAGVSAASGIPPFRGKDGIWQRIDPVKYAHIDVFNSHPEKVWNGFILKIKPFIDAAQPNSAHIGLRTLEKLERLRTIITQNVDGLHQAAGSSDVIDFHGNFAWYRCTECARRVSSRALDTSRIPPRCECGGTYRPECVFFGEDIPADRLDRAQAAAGRCDAMLVLGTSATVAPAADLPVLARENGAKIIEINTGATPLSRTVTDILITGQAGPMLSGILDQMGMCCTDWYPY